MAFDTAFNITWNQRVNKEENSFLKFLDKRKKEGLTTVGVPEEKRSSRRATRAMSDADLLSAVRSVRDDDSNVPGTSKSKGRSTSQSKLERRGGSAASSSVLQKAGSTVSSPSQTRGAKKSRGKAPPMTFEQMQEGVFNQQMNRYIKDLEVEAKEANIENEWTRQKIKDGLQQEIDEKTKARTLASENQRKVQEQIEENKMRRANTRKSFVEAASAHNFPLFTETFISQDEVDQYRKDVKVEFRKDLDAQNRVTQTLKNILVKKDRIYAEQQMTKNIKNMQDDHSNVHHEQRRKGNEMMRVWDRDIRLKNIKNAIFAGKDATKEMGANN